MYVHELSSLDELISTIELCIYICTYEWSDVHKYSLQVNTFQAVLATDGRHSFAIFNYLDDGINWNKGDASTVPAQVGFNFGGKELNTFTLPGSRMENITEIDTMSNLNRTGQYVYRIDDIVPLDTCNSTIGMLL